jgi:hypothetical protein
LDTQYKFHRPTLQSSTLLCCLQVCFVLLQTENMLDMMTLTAGLTTNSTEESAVARHLHVTVCQRVEAPEAMPFHHMHLHKRSQRQSLQLLPIRLPGRDSVATPTLREHSTHPTAEQREQTAPHHPTPQTPDPLHTPAHHSQQQAQHPQAAASK